MSNSVATKANLPRGLSNLVKFTLREHVKAQGALQEAGSSLKKLYHTISEDISEDVVKVSGIAFLTDENMHPDIKEINQRNKEKLTTIPFSPEDVACFDEVNYPLKGNCWVAREAGLYLNLEEDNVSNAKCLAGMILKKALEGQSDMITSKDEGICVHGFQDQTQKPSADLCPDNVQDLLQGHLIIFDSWVEQDEVGRVIIYPVMLDTVTGRTTFGTSETHELGDPVIEREIDEYSYDDR